MSIVKFIIFADDTNVFLKHNDVKEAYSILNNELTRLSVWFNTNKLTVNTNKTKYIIFKSMNKVIDTAGLELLINGNIIENMTETKFLGVCLDQFLTFKAHIDTIAAKISKAIGIMNRLKYYFPNNILLTIYNALVLPHLHDTITIWGSACQT